MKFNPEEKNLLLKAERFCAYQERCRQEVKQKLRELGATDKDSQSILAALEEDDFLNEMRFAKLFTSGKFRIKRWGKNKIRAELRRRKIPDTVISDALESIDDGEYLEIIRRLAKQKLGRVAGSPPPDQKKKVVLFLLSRGFESASIWKALKYPEDEA